jgi:hypothetical protein
MATSERAPRADANFNVEGVATRMIVMSVCGFCVGFLGTGVGTLFVLWKYLGWHFAVAACLAFWVALLGDYYFGRLLASIIFPVRSPSETTTIGPIFDLLTARRVSFALLIVFCILGGYLGFKLLDDICRTLCRSTNDAIGWTKMIGPTLTDWSGHILAIVTGWVGACFLWAIAGALEECVVGSRFLKLATENPEPDAEHLVQDPLGPLGRGSRDHRCEMVLPPHAVRDGENSSMP